MLLGAGCSATGSRKRVKAAGSVKGPRAVLVTSRGRVVLRLLPEEAPKTVANFIALAEGSKEWTDPRSGRRVRRPLYDGTLFFRVLPGLMIQGGDPLDDGSGSPGYRIPDEIFPGRRFDVPGLAAMASGGPDASGSQFFITTNAAPFLNGKHTIFGEVVEGLDVAREIAAAPRVRFEPETGRRIDRPVSPPVLEKVLLQDGKP